MHEVTIEVKTNAPKIAAMIGAIPSELLKAQTIAAKRVGQRYLAYHRARRMRGGKGVKGTAKGIRSHFKATVEGTTINNLTLTMGTRSRVAIEHERGGVLKPKGTALLIPFSKFSPARRKTFRKLAKARKLILIRARDGRAYLARPTTSRRQFRLQFEKQENLVAHLQRQVVLKPRLGFIDEWRGYKAKAMEEYQRGVKHALKAASVRAK